MPHKRKDLKIEGSNLWYLVGLITSDGNLSIDGRHVNITSKDRDFLCELKNTIGLKNKIGLKYNSQGDRSYYIMLSNKLFYKFLLSIGLIPAKSFSLGAIDVPVKFFADFLRGIVDGDGNIQRWIHPTNGREQWILRIYSGSKLFIEWLKNRIEKVLLAKGRIHVERRKSPRRSQYILKYGKMAAKVILQQCYYRGALSLKRKSKLAQECLISYVGWRKSKTVIC